MEDWFDSSSNRIKGSNPQPTSRWRLRQKEALSYLSDLSVSFFSSLTVGASRGVVGRWRRPTSFAPNRTWRRHLPVPVLAVVWRSPEALWLEITQGNWEVEEETLTHTNLTGFFICVKGKRWKIKRFLRKIDSTLFSTIQNSPSSFSTDPKVI